MPSTESHCTSGSCWANPTKLYFLLPDYSNDLLLQLGQMLLLSKEISGERVTLDNAISVVG